MKVKKTNAMRILDAEQIEYNVITYESKDGKIDGASVANKVGMDPAVVYKTLVACGSEGNYVFVIPVEAELDLKKAAKAAGEKKIELIPVKDIQAITGYIRGGCSPIGMKRLFPTYIDESVHEREQVVVSGGKIGVQIEITTFELIAVTKAEVVVIAK
ncbi:Cys-tRNA(Pro) deacylase [Desertibacillus haloalkaliphilus]|uniref:Cys-tRNA(Pro) deacylase n=1 Tax=Desertibacillus haloalkaliphilus TaxID=1328930 RepID=UPI001C27D7B0|nr:Cys-tRNA(Pro) deacylase [Desertibacillus haloalkaliphilus]MBU8905807.1 Cys-tRNA(Pro) deacylase [Desertibacillus haloalkaliphilus]